MLRISPHSYSLSGNRRRVVVDKPHASPISSCVR
jgi:hypothetical protein